MSGPLTGYTLIEVAGIGPGPMAAMMLGDMGANVVRIDRTRTHVMDRFADPKFNVHGRSRRSVSVDLQKPEGAEVVLRLCAKADGIMEPFRPGVAELLFGSAARGLLFADLLGEALPPPLSVVQLRAARRIVPASAAQ